MTADYIQAQYTEARQHAARARATMNTATGRAQGAAADELEFWTSKSANMHAAAKRHGFELESAS